MLELLDPFEHLRRGLVVELDPDRGGLLDHADPSGELGDQQLALVADQRRSDVLERAGVGAHAGDVHASLMGEGIAPDVGLVGVGRDVEQLVDEVRRLGEPRELLVGEAAETELELQVRDDRDEVGVAGSLPAAVHRALDLARADLDRGQRVGDGALGVVVAVDSNWYGVAEGADRGARRDGHLRGQRGPVGVAQRHGLGPGLRGGTDARQRVLGLGAVAVEIVLGVVDHALAGCAQEGDRLGDHPQVLLAVDLDELLEVQRPGLADQRADRGDAVGERRERRVVGGGDPAPARHAEGGDLGVGEALAREQLEQLALLRIRRREAGLDQVDAELVELVGDAQLLVGREGHPLALHAVAQRCVI